MFPEATVRVLPRSYSDHSHLVIYTQELKEWNKEVFGNIFKRKIHLLTRIEGIQKALATYFSHNLHALERDLIKQYNSTLFQEEILWFQKSRAKHIMLGDRNTKYFHISTISKRRKTKINSFKDNAGSWITETDEIKAAILDYFQNLFNSEDTTHLDHWNNPTQTHFTHDDNIGFLKPISNSKILRVVLDIGTFKAPGKDGI
ncbi:uncharacterized protein LOC114263917 [Camellia sinensis]|uniref:uncharacterized protein LOC114263917 n=1 Tax=Camellia sinensis TaxID=4442 RepID=UPI0010356240|nr:uncharacterized protein LOC114263917 [Camellia sinensis]